jgi:hypothetical protein
MRGRRRVCGAGGENDRFKNAKTAKTAKNCWWRVSGDLQPFRSATKTRNHETLSVFFVISWRFALY